MPRRYPDPCQSADVRYGWKADVDGVAASALADAVLRTGLLGAGLIALGGCSDGCVNALISRADAPDGVRSAVMFQRDCGATTGFSTQISIVEHGDEPSGSGNVFRADDDHGAAAAGEWGGPWAEMRWLAPDRLLVRYAAKSRLFQQNTEILGVKISYHQVTR
jgi:hypothetical protein